MAVVVAKVQNGASPYREMPAVFASTLSPGYIAGGSQCTLAYLEAVSTLHGGNVLYVGPPFLKGVSLDHVRLSRVLNVERRSTASKVFGIVSGTCVDRMSEPACSAIDSISDLKTIVYVNGEFGGRVVEYAMRQGLRTVFIPHNFPPEYLAAETQWWNVPKRWRNLVGSRCALIGFSRASACVCLSRVDGQSFQRATAFRPRVFDDMYFGYQDRGETLEPRCTSEDGRVTVLIGTNMALRQNESGVLWFLDEVWPHFSMRDNWHLILAGRYPGPRIYAAAQRFERVEIVSRPEHSEMEALFRRSNVCVASTFEGSGIKLRVAEALRHGLPVVSTEHCARGYDRVSHNLVKVYRAGAEAIDHLESLGRCDREAIRRRCLSEYARVLSFDAGIERLRSCVSTLCDAHPCVERMA